MVYMTPPSRSPPGAPRRGLIYSRLSLTSEGESTTIQKDARFLATKFSYWMNTDPPTFEHLDTSSGTCWVACSEAQFVGLKVKPLIGVSN